jgi:hypothetical protein
MSAQVPQIVATVNLLSQTAGTTTTTLFTPAANGWYRVNAYYLRTSGTGNGGATWNWTDENGVSQQSQIDQARPIYVQGGNPITATASYTGTGTYNLRFVIESL